MKLVLALLFSPLVGTVTARADDPTANQLVPVAVRAIFAPDGFDDNDEAQVVIDGFLPSTCYRLAENAVTVDPVTREITVVQYARKFAEPCLPMRVPFSNDVRLGVLPHATFTVKAHGAPEMPLTVKEALNGGPDDYFYAPVDAARVEFDFEANAYVATIGGRLTNSCLEWSDLKVIDQGGVFVLMPMLAMRQDAVCVAVETPFERKVALPGRLSAGRHLLHVRSLNGKAVNTMFSAGRL